MGRHAPFAADRKPAQAGRRPLYARSLRLRHIAPGGLACFVLFEGSAGAAVILALSGLLSWWVLLVLPVSVAVMVKLNDVVAGRLNQAVTPTSKRAAR
jgi:hypothetical protein